MSERVVEGWHVVNCLKRLAHDASDLKAETGCMYSIGVREGVYTCYTGMHAYLTLKRAWYWAKTVMEQGRARYGRNGWPYLCRVKVWGDLGFANEYPYTKRTKVAGRHREVMGIISMREVWGKVKKWEEKQLREELDAALAVKREGYEWASESLISAAITVLSNNTRGKYWDRVERDVLQLMRRKGMKV